MTTSSQSRQRGATPGAGPDPEPLPCCVCERPACDGRLTVEGEPLCAACADFLDELPAAVAAHMLPYYAFAGLAIGGCLLFFLVAVCG